MDAIRATALYKEAEALYRDDKLLEADTILSELDSAFPNTKNIMFARARCFAALGNREGAEALCRSLIEDYDYGRARVLLASIARGQDEFDSEFADSDALFDEPTYITNENSDVSKKFEKIIPKIALVFIVLVMLVASTIIGKRNLPSDTQNQSAQTNESAEATTGRASTAHPAENIPETKLYDINALLRDLNYSSRREEAYAQLCRVAKVDDLNLIHGYYPDLRSDKARWRALWILGEVGSPESVVLLKKELKEHPSRYVRRTAAYSLGKIGSTSAIMALENALFDDPEVQVKQRAAWALDQIMGREAEPILRRALEQNPNGGASYSLKWLLDYAKKGTQLPRIVPGEASYGVLNDTQYKIYVPSTYTSDREWPLLVSVHGMNGHPDPYEKMWREDAERYGFVVLAPFFDSPNHPYYNYLQLHRNRSDLFLLDAISAVGEVLSIKTDKFYLFGHSRGGQFVTRFALLHPDRLIKAAACGSATYVFPDPNRYFPDGLKRNPLMRPADKINIDGMLALPLAIVIGTNDTQQRNDLAMKFISMTNEYAAQHGVYHNTSVIHVPGGRHAGYINRPYASKFFFSNLGR